ncbi:hypothetical protein Tco_0233449 [Tanacetum coccineum]
MSHRTGNFREVLNESSVENWRAQETTDTFDRNKGQQQEQHLAQIIISETEFEQQEGWTSFESSVREQEGIVSFVASYVMIDCFRSLDGSTNIRTEWSEDQLFPSIEIVLTISHEDTLTGGKQEVEFGFETIGVDNQN